MNEDNKIFKTNEFSIEVSPVENTKQVKNVQYFSYDENSGLQLIHILMDGKPLDLPNGTEIRLSAVKLNNQNQKLIYTPEIVDPLKGIVSFVIPREFLGYRGQIRCGLYINFSNNQTMHVGYFYINMGVSDIDTNLTEFTEDFWQGWSEFEASSTAKMQELEAVLDAEAERLTEHANQKITEYDQYIASGKSDWEDFVTQNREILESIDPGGTILSEIINATGDFDKLADRVATAQTYQNFEELNLINPQIGQSYTVVNNGNPQKYKILTEGFPNGFSVVDLGNGKYAHRYFDSYNDWLQGLKQKNFAAHKGFNATSNQAKLAGAYPGNTIRAFEEAGKLGFGMVELDIQNCLDDWLVIHDANTATLEHGSDTELISGLTAAEITSRKLVKEYVTSGYYWNYSETSSGYSVPLLKDVLAVCKKYGMYALVEIKATSATDTQIENLATIIRQSGMEERCIIFGSYPDLNMRTLKLLPNAIYGSVVGTDSDERLINLAKSFKNHFVSMNSTSSDATYQFLKDNQIPFGVWTIDNYQDAEAALKKGAVTVTTNRLISGPNFANYNQVNSYSKNDLISVFKNNGSGGTTVLDSEGDVHISSSGTYFSKTLTLPAATLPPGYIVRVKCTAKTNSASPKTNVGRIYFSNGGTASALTVIEDVIRFDTNYYQTKEMTFTVGKSNVLNNLTLSVGLAGQNVAGTGEMEIKEFTVDIYAPADIDLTTERYGMIFAWDALPAIHPQVANFGITNVSVDSADKSTLVVDYVPFSDTTKKPICIAVVNGYGDGNDANKARNVVTRTLNSELGQIKMNVINADGTKVADLTNQFRMGFDLIIKI